MKKIFFVVALATVMLTTTSGFNEQRFGTEPDEMAPAFTVTDSGRTLSLGDLRGRYALITFWNTTDARSRVACSEYQTMVASDAGLSKILTAVSVNFDESETLFREIVRIDGLSSEAQYHADGRQAESLKADYGLDAGMRTVLIDPSGKVVAYNPSKAFLKNLVA